MKNLLLLGLAAMLAMGSQAANVKDAVKLTHPMRSQHMTLSERAANANATLVTNKAKKVAVKADAPITEAPAGTEYKDMYVTSESFGMGWGDVYYQKVDGGLGAVVEGNDGCLYIKGPISQAYVWGLGFPYIKCEKTGDNTYVMKTPQCYAIDYGDPYYVQRLKYDEENDTYVVDETNTDVTFKWENNVLTQVDDCYFGLTDATGEWYYMADNEVKYEANPDKKVEVPDGATAGDVRMTFNDDAEDLESTDSRMVEVFTSGDKQYMNHVDKYATDLVMEMTVDANGGKTVVSGQYIGVDEDYNSHMYILTGDAKVATQGDYTYFNYDKTQSMTFVKDGNVCKAAYPASIIVNCGRNTLYIGDEFVAPVLEEVADEAMVPADPENLTVTEGTSHDLMKFTIPTVDVDGKELNVNKLSYVVYYNDNVYTFTPELFEGLEEDMTEIPYGFTDSNYDIWHSSSTGKETIYFYDMLYDKVGVQSVYRGGNEENRSNVVYYYRSTSGVNNLNTEVRTVKSEAYYNAAGQRVDANATGFVVKRIVFTDGTTATYKVVK